MVSGPIFETRSNRRQSSSAIRWAVLFVHPIVSNFHVTENTAVLSFPYAQTSVQYASTYLQQAFCIQLSSADYDTNNY